MGAVGNGLVEVDSRVGSDNGDEVEGDIGVIPRVARDWEEEELELEGGSRTWIPLCEAGDEGDEEEVGPVLDGGRLRSLECDPITKGVERE